MRSNLGLLHINVWYNCAEDAHCLELEPGNVVREKTHEEC